MFLLEGLDLVTECVVDKGPCAEVCALRVQRRAESALWRRTLDIVAGFVVVGVFDEHESHDRH